jgi:hypothetical protein
VTPDGSTVFVTGSSGGSNFSADYTTVAYSTTTGAKVWVERYDGPGHFDDFASALGVSPDGSTVFVTGGSTGSNGFGEEDYATVAYDAATGAREWVSRYDGPAHLDDGADAMAVSPDGSTVFVTGDSNGSNGYDYATVAYDAGDRNQGVGQALRRPGPRRGLRLRAGGEPRCVDGVRHRVEHRVGPQGLRHRRLSHRLGSSSPCAGIPSAVMAVRAVLGAAGSVEGGATFRPIPLTFVAVPPYRLGLGSVGVSGRR